MEENCLIGMLIKTLNIKYSNFHKKKLLVLEDWENFPESQRLDCEMQ